MPDSSRSLIVFGAGGHGTVVADAAMAAGRTVECFLDDAPRSATALGLTVHNSASIDRFAGRDFIVGIGDNAVRERVFRTLKDQRRTIATIIHPAATISRFATIGEGVFIAAGAVVNPNARIGDNSIINTCASVDHDCRIGASVHICPGVHLAGAVTVGDGTIIGTGASAIPGVSIGCWCMVRAGSVIVRNVDDRSKVGS